MSITFNADEIFEMAEEIERNGAKFYKRSAEIVTDVDARKIFLELAAMEIEHEKAFAQMRSQLSSAESEQVTFDPDDEAALYLRAMADGHVFDVRKNPADQLTGSETPQEILQTAIGAEKDSIIFYLGIKDMVPAGAGKDKVDAIIAEEMNHIVILSGELQDSKQA